MSKNVKIISTFLELSDYQDSDASIKQNDFSMESTFTSVKRSSRSSMEEIGLLLRRKMILSF